MQPALPHQIEEPQRASPISRLASGVYENSKLLRCQLRILLHCAVDQPANKPSLPSEAAALSEEIVESERRLPEDWQLHAAEGGSRATRKIGAQQE